MGRRFYRSVARVRGRCTCTLILATMAFVPCLLVSLYLDLELCHEQSNCLEHSTQHGH